MEFDYSRLAEEMLKQMPGHYTSILLTDFVEQVVAFMESNRAKKTCEGVRLVCKKLLNFFPGNRELNTIHLKDAENFLESIKKGAPKGIYNYHRTLRAMWNKAKEWNYVQNNPFEKVKLKKRQLQKPVYVTEVQLEEIVKHIEVEVVRDVVITAFYSGCRLGEIINLTWQDVKLNDDFMLIGNKDFETKARKQRIVPLHTRIREILLRRFPIKIYKAGSKPTPLIPLPRGEATLLIPVPRGGKNRMYVFSKSNGYPFTGDYFSKRFKRACRAAGIDEEIHFHCLRHGAATRMVMNGAPLPSVQKIMGHANIQTTMLYTHPDLESLREAVAKL